MATMARTPPDKQSEFHRRNRAGVVSVDAGAASAAAFAKAGFTDPTLVLRWTEIAGAEVARLARPLRFSDSQAGGTLTLKAVPGAALFLAHEKRSLAERINAYLGRPAVTQIKFVQGPLAARPMVKNVEKKPGPLRPADPASLYNGPESLKDALKALARRRNLAP
jgi:hypothetical protein